MGRRQNIDCCLQTRDKVFLWLCFLSPSLRSPLQIVKINNASDDFFDIVVEELLSRNESENVLVDCLECQSRLFLHME